MKTAETAFAAYCKREGIKADGQFAEETKPHFLAGNGSRTGSLRA